MSEEFCDQFTSYRDMIKNVIASAFRMEKSDALEETMRLVDKRIGRGDELEKKRSECRSTAIYHRISISIGVLRVMGIIVVSDKEILDAIETLYMEVCHESATQKTVTAEGILK